MGFNVLGGLIRGVTMEADSVKSCCREPASMCIMTRMEICGFSVDEFTFSFCLFFLRGVFGASFQWARL